MFNPTNGIGKHEKKSFCGNRRDGPVTDMPDYFGPASFHENDYSFFYKNLQDNVAKRIAAYKAN